MPYRPPVRDASQVTVPQIFLIGMAAAFVAFVTTTIFKAIGLTHVNLNLFFGSFWTESLGRQSQYVGFLFRLFLGGVIAQVYAVLFRSSHRTGIGFGLSLGLLHWFLAGIATGILSAIHPLIPTQLTSPGLFVLGGGFGSALSYLITHLIFGATVGMIFDYVAQLDDLPEALNAR